MLALVAAGFAVQTTQSASAIGFSTFNALHFEINYFDHGFVRRALVGTVFQVVPDAWRTVAIIGFGWALVVALALVVVWLLHALRARLPRDQCWLLAVLWIAAPFTFLNFGYDFARLDQLNLLLLALSLCLVYRGHGLALALISATGLLIHEAYLFYGLAPVLAYAWVRYRAVPSSTSARVLFWPLVAALATLSAIAFAGRYEAGRSSLVQSLGSRLGDPNHNALNVWLRSGLDNPEYVIGRLGHGLFGTPELLAIGGLVLGIVAALIGISFANGRRPDVFVVSPLAVLPLFFFGIDYARWLGLIATLALTVVTTQVLEGRFAGLGVACPRVFYLLLVGVVLLGPLGSVHLLPLWLG